MRENKGVSFILYLLTVQTIVISQPIYAMSCTDGVSGEGAATKSKIVQVDFSQKKGGKSQTARHKEIHRLGEEVVVPLKIPKLEVGGNNTNGSKNEKVANEVLVFIEAFQKYILHGVRTKFEHALSQNTIWIVHGQYSLLSRFVEYLGHPKNGYSRLTFEKVKERLDQLERVIEETRFFELLERRGYTLVPAANQIVKDLLPADLAKPLVDFGFHLQLVRINLGSLNGKDGIYGDKIRQRLFNGGDRNHTFATLIDYLENFNNYLRKVRSEVEVLTTDVGKVELLIQKTEQSLSLSVLERALYYASQSPFPKTQELVTRLKELIGQFKVIAFAIKSPNKSPVNADGLNISKGFSDIDVQRFGEELKSVLIEMDKSGSRLVVEWNYILTKYLTRLESKADIEISSESRAKLIEYLGWLRKEAEYYPSKHSLFNMEAKDEVEASIQIRNNVERVLQILGEPN